MTSPNPLATAIEARDACYRTAELIAAIPAGGWFGAEHDAVRGVGDQINDWIEARRREALDRLIADDGDLI